MHDINSKRMLKLCLDLRGFYLKTGQFLGTRHDFMPKQYIKLLSTLQDNVPPLNGQAVLQLIEDELLSSHPKTDATNTSMVNKYFTYINVKKPIGSASIAQVHYGIWRPTNEEVAIKIQYPNASMMKSAGMQDSSFLPLKINISGVIPPIFASSILMFPIAIMQFIGSENDFISIALRRGGAVYLIAFAGLILFFSYFYSSIVFNTEEVANNLKKSNCFILGIRPGKTTSDYLDKIVSKLTLIGAIYLIFVCIIPEILVTNYSIPLQIGGTGILIMVNVVLDLVNQFQSHLYASKYGNIANTKKRRIKIRA
jgi:preprotein translocase subunit SecY